jgi:hypothetical protein
MNSSPRFRGLQPHRRATASWNLSDLAVLTAEHTSAGRTRSAHAPDRTFAAHIGVSGSPVLSSCANALLVSVNSAADALLSSWRNSAGLGPPQVRPPSPFGRRSDDRRTSPVLPPAPTRRRRVGLEGPIHGSSGGPPRPVSRLSALVGAEGAGICLGRSRARRSCCRVAGRDKPLAGESKRRPTALATGRAGEGPFHALPRRRARSRERSATVVPRRDSFLVSLARPHQPGFFFARRRLASPITPLARPRKPRPTSALYPPCSRGIGPSAQTRRNNDNDQN